MIGYRLLIVSAILCGTVDCPAQYFTDFEDWPITAEGYWSLEGPGGWYIGDGVYVNFGNESSGLRKVGFNDPDDILELPPVTNPTGVSFWARLSSGTAAYIAVQYYNGLIWHTVGSFRVASTDYRLFSVEINYPHEDVPIRLWMTSYGNSIFLDDLSVDAAPLPVELAAFTARAEPGRGVALHWQTITETNNERFDLLRSADGQRFTIIASRPGAGNSATPRRYAYLDAAPFPGTSYYRLRQVDFDGTAWESAVVSVVTDVPAAGLTIAPTVTTGTLRLIAAPSHRARTVRIVDASGRVFDTALLPPGEGEQTIAVAHLLPGLYLLHLEDGGKRETRRFVRQ